MSNTKTDFVTPSEAARFLERSEGWVRHAADTGLLPCTFATGGRRLFRRADLEKYLAQKTSERPVS